MLSQGDILKNKYRIIKKIGEGGMSVVWLAEDHDLGKLWAVKEIDKSTAEFKRNVNEDGSLTEVEVLKNLDHPFAPRVTDIYETEESICVVMDYVEGESLQRILNRVGPQNQEVVTSWMIDVCKLLHFLHGKHIIYRDIKPANIILTESGGIKVIDYGIAKIVQGRDYKDKAPLGTKGYASPEHAAKCTTELSDIYTVGITLYQLLTGVSPTKKGFTVMPLKTVNPELSSGLDEIILKATREDPKERYQSMSALIDALRNYKKLEKPYISKLKKKIAVSKALLVSAVLCLSVGFLGFEGLELKEIRDYNALLNKGSLIGSEQVENYIEAVKLRPGSEEAYLKLLSAYEDSLSKERLSEIFSLYDEYYEPNHAFITKGYTELNYQIAESALANYEGLSFSQSKKRLELVKPYLERASLKETDFSQTANAYLAVLRSFEEYDDKLSISSEEAANIVQTLKVLVFSHSQSFGKGTQRKQLASYEIVLDFTLDNIDLLRRSKSFSEVKALVNQIENALEKMTVAAEDTDAASQVASKLIAVKDFL